MSFGTLLRPALLAVATLACLASAPASTQPSSPYPYGGAPSQPGAYGSGAYGGDPYGAYGAPGTAGPPGAAPGQDYCYTLRTSQTVTSFCAVGFGACERSRQGALADGLSTTDCVPWAPVACFQLGGDPSPQASFCAANLEDCEIWRAADREKNGATGDACAWKQ